MGTHGITYRKKEKQLTRYETRIPRKEINQKTWQKSADHLSVLDFAKGLAISLPQQPVPELKTIRTDQS